MEVDQVFVHPLVVMSMADHSTRNRIQKDTPKACGILLGQTSGNIISVLECFEMVFTENENSLVPNLEALQTDLNLFRETYPDSDFLGWYTTRSAIESFLVQTHQMLERFSERSFMIVLDPDADADSKELPMNVYELKNLTGEDAFEKVPFQVVSDEAERVTLDYCAKVVQEVAVGDVSAVVTPFTLTTKAIDSLSARVAKIALYLEDVKSGAQQPDQALLREIRGLCNRLPAMDTDSFHEDYMQELNDAMLMTYLATITTSSATSRQVVTTFNTAYAGRQRGEQLESSGGLGGIASVMAGMGGIGGMMGRGFF
jgi:COP9 signalosome complex subunit 6